MKRKRKAKTRNHFPETPGLTGKCVKKMAKRVKENPNKQALSDLWKERKDYKTLIKKKKMTRHFQNSHRINEIQSKGPMRILEKNF